LLVPGTQIITTDRSHSHTQSGTSPEILLVTIDLSPRNLPA